MNERNATNAYQLPGICIVRSSGPLFYANANSFYDGVLSLASQHCTFLTPVSSNDLPKDKPVSTPLPEAQGEEQFSPDGP
ncbi:unnamed protein product, partial [Protopolystoma xenopodis]